jgi:hypothetical protein
LLQIRTTGRTNTTTDRPLAWDRPIDAKLILFLQGTDRHKIGKFPLKGFKVSWSSFLQSGLRYTPYTQTGYASDGRPQYEIQDDKPYSAIGSMWFWTDVRFGKDFILGRKYFLNVYIECRNIFNNRNAQIINPVTGRAYEYGDPLPNDQRDPSRPNPLDSGTPPFNPARYMAPRQLVFGGSFSF